MCLKCDILPNGLATIYKYAPRGSMYGIQYMLTFGVFWGILMANVTIYSIHGSYGYQILSNTCIIVENPRSLHRW